MKWLSKISGEQVAFTGKAWLKRSDLQKIVRRLGGCPTTDGDVTTETTVLVRGQSESWKYGDHGKKERRAAELIRAGQRIVLVHDFKFQKLAESGRKARLLDRVAGMPVDWLTDPGETLFAKAASIKGPLDRQHSASGRVEQSYLRHVLFRDANEATCSLCGRRLPVSLLIAAHIKPRSECSRRERLDATNIVFGICVLGCDALYECGLIAVSDGGQICIAPTIESLTLEKVLGRYARRKCSAWSETTAEYFGWHLARRFQG